LNRRRGRDLAGHVRIADVEMFECPEHLSQLANEQRLAFRLRKTFDELWMGFPRRTRSVLTGTPARRIAAATRLGYSPWPAINATGFFGSNAAGRKEEKHAGGCNRRPEE